MMLTDEQIDFYHTQGYLMIENVLSDVELHTLQQITESYIDQSRKIKQSDEIYDLDSGHCEAQPRLTRIKLPHTLHPAFWDLITGEKLTAMMKKLVGENIRLHTSKLNTKAPGGGAAVEWHQDWAFYPHTNDDMLAVGVMLKDVDQDNGPLMVIPGSHKGPVLDHTSGGVFCGAVDPQDPQFDIAKAVTLTGKAGSVSFHHVRILHGSAPNLSDRARMLLFYECGATDAWPINGNASTFTGLSQQQFWEAMSEKLICGEQSLWPRLEKVPITMPLPPAPDSSSIFKVQQSGGARSAFTG